MLASEPKTPTTATITEVICITSPEKAFPQGAYTHASFHNSYYTKKEKNCKVYNTTHYTFLPLTFVIKFL